MNKAILGISSQKLILFNLGKAMSGPPTINGNKKLPLEIGHASRQYPLKEPCMRISPHTAHPISLSLRYESFYKLISS